MRFTPVALSPAPRWFDCIRLPALTLMRILQARWYFFVNPDAWR